VFNGVQGELRVEREQKARPHAALSPRKGKLPLALGGFEGV